MIRKIKNYNAIIKFIRHQREQRGIPAFQVITTKDRMIITSDDNGSSVERMEIKY